MFNTEKFSNRDWLLAIVGGIVFVAFLAVLAIPRANTGPVEYTGIIQEVVDPFNFVDTDGKEIRLTGMPEELVVQVEQLSAMERQQLIDVLASGESAVSDRQIVGDIHIWSPFGGDRRVDGVVILNVEVNGRPYADVLDDALNERIEQYDYCNLSTTCDAVF